MRIKNLLLLLLHALLLLPLLGAAAEESGAGTQPLYYKLAPSLVTNVQGRARYIRCDIQLMTRKQAALEALKLHAPAIRHELLLLLSDQQGEALKDPKGKEELRKTALAAVQGVMQGLTGTRAVDELFFTSFFVQ
ncbi:MAG TPA: flagellar basal body protein FliL [Sedimenticola sp.]|nr:flagellar basal body protein FliL [Sedimenticola sp.]